MKRIDSINARPNINGTGKTGFSDNADLAGQDATYLTPDWCNHVQEEIANVIEGFGESLKGDSNDQLYQILKTLNQNLSNTIDALNAEKEARISADLNHIEASNPHPQYALSSDSSFLYLEPSTQVNPAVYTNDAENWIVKHTIELVSANILASGYIEQTLLITHTAGEYNCDVYLPIAVDKILSITTGIQSLGNATVSSTAQASDDDVNIRIIKTYTEDVATQTDGSSTFFNVLRIRTDWLSVGANPGNVKKTLYIKVTGYRADKAIFTTLENYPYSNSN